MRSIYRNEVYIMHIQELRLRRTEVIAIHSPATAAHKTGSACVLLQCVTLSQPFKGACTYLMVSFTRQLFLLPWESMP